MNDNPGLLRPAPMTGAIPRVRPRRLRRPGAVLVAGLGLLGFGPGVARAEESLLARGRETYIAEGCINCHSQYVRPGVPEEIERWGPARPLAEILAESPPLIGLRRQGPDLMNVGNRRNPEWNRLHLLAPRAVAPGSRMPSYAHLFAGDGARGEALVAYLASLGTGTMADRLATVAAWQPDPAPAPLAPAAARQLFTQLCAACHGRAGRGDGPLAPRFLRAPRNLVHDRWLYLGTPADAEAERTALARTIKFGLPGTAMAGHEYLSDAAALALANYVQTLRAAPAPP